MKVYGVGYQGRTVEELRALAESLDAVIVDVRYSPLSRLPNWRIHSLRHTLPDYHHIQAFGNANYRNGGPIEIADYEAGKAEIKEIDRNVILMCVCKDPHICHRTVLLQKLSADGFETEELNKSKPSCGETSMRQIEMFPNGEE